MTVLWQVQAGLTLSLVVCIDAPKIGGVGNAKGFKHIAGVQHHHIRATAAGMFWPPHHQDAELDGHHVEPLRHVLIDAVQLAGTAAADVALHIDRDLDPRQMCGQSPAVCPAFGDPFGLLGGHLLLGHHEASGLKLFGFFQGEHQLVLGQALSQTAEAVTLQLLDDLAQALDLRAIGIDWNVSGSKGSAVESEAMTRNRSYSPGPCEPLQPAVTGVVVRCTSWIHRQSSPSS